MTDIEKAIKWIESGIWSQDTETTEMVYTILEALKEKQDRDMRMQWLDDMENPLEPIKIQAALDSEIMKLEYRKEHKPQDVSELDYTIIYALIEALERALNKEEVK